MSHWKELDYFQNQHILPNLKRLQLQKNEMKSCRSNEDWPHLLELDMSHNQLSDWLELLEQLGSRWPKLARLIVSNNNLKDELHLVPEINRYQYPLLEHLSLDHNALHDWQTLALISQLFPNLLSLRLQFAPLVDKSGPVAARHLSIFFFPQLQKLNGSDVNAADKAESAKFFMQWYAALLATAEEARTARFSVSPSREDAHSFLSLLETRYQQLTAQYGSDVVPLAAEEAAKDATLTSDLVDVTITSLHPLSSSFQPLTLRLLSSTKVSDLQIICFNHFGVAADLQKLAFRHSKHDLPQVLDDANLPLFMYGISSRQPIEILLS